MALTPESKLIIHLKSSQAEKIMKLQQKRVESLAS